MGFPEHIDTILNCLNIFLYLMLIHYCDELMKFRILLFLLLLLAPTCDLQTRGRTGSGTGTSEAERVQYYKYNYNKKEAQIPHKSS